MNVSVFGLGYVGCVSAACLAGEGHRVIGVDNNPTKVDMLNRSRSPIVEPGVEDLIRRARQEHSLEATEDGYLAVRKSDVTMVCVGTPARHNGSLDFTHIKATCRQIGEALEGKKSFHIVAIRSTVLPGTAEEIVIPTLEVYSGKRAGRDFGVAVNPEFLREGSSIDDFRNPPFTIIGATDEDTGAQMERMYRHIAAPTMRMNLREAEMIKYACNCFHAVKITFANEIGNICKSLNVDSHRIMEAVCMDKKLNLSPYYLTPGFAFGGSCLPKDLCALTYKAKELDVDVPMLGSVLAANRRQVERAIDMVLRTGRRNVGVLGLSFKSGTDDLRESPMVTLIEALIGKGLHLAIYDKEVELARLFGANKEYIEREIPHISSLMQPSIADVIDSSDVIVVGKKEREYGILREKLNNGKVIVDLVRLLDGGDRNGTYQGICW
jgi:GDP-mannose 6-dehydrogenase